MIKKILIIFLGLMIAIGCQNENLDPSLSQQQEDPKDSDLITTNGSTSSTDPSSIANFINKYRGLYYANNNVKYKLKDGKLMNYYNKVTEVQAVMGNKMQISNYSTGKIDVLNFSKNGFTSYVSYILEKVNDIADTEGMTLIGNSGKLASYAGTYKSIFDKQDKFLIITPSGQIYYHENIGEGRVYQSSDGKQLMIIDNEGTRNTVIFEQGVYRKYNFDPKDVDKTGEWFKRNEELIDDLVAKSGASSLIYEGKGFDGTRATIKLNNNGYIELVSTGNAIPIIGPNRIWDVPEQTIVKGNTLYIMKFGATLTLTDDFSALTYKDSKGDKNTFTINRKQ